MQAILTLLLLLGLGVLGFVVAGIRYVPNNRVGIVEKRFALKGSVKADSFIALNREAGYQPNVLRGGLTWLMPIQYKVHLVPLVTIPQGQIGYVFARDGIPLAPTQALGCVVPEGKTFQDVEGFLKNGGQRGPQREILREGTYALNLVLFVVFTEDGLYYLPISREEEAVFKRMGGLLRERDAFRPVVIKGSDDKIGIVTVHDGPALEQDEIIAPAVGTDPSDPTTYHNNFQDPEKFLRAGGRRGRQLQVIVEGTYYINRLFATVELINKTIVEVGFVGVVVSYAGSRGGDVSGEEYKHGELVQRGEKGVWSEPLMPGKYAFNTYAGQIIMVPTTNIILKWNKDEMGTHRFDENLSAIELITKDAFEPVLPLSVVMHIDYRKAPLVIQRFGDIKKLVDQTLDPMVAAYFKNIGQTRTLIQLIQERSQIQQQASQEMQERFAHYNLELEEVLIGTPASSTSDRKIEEILAQLRDRQIAIEQIETYNRKQQAAAKERELRQAEAIAKQQTALTESEISITIQSNEGKAAYQRSLQEAAKIRALAEAEAERDARIGIARAIAIEEQVRAYGGPQFQVLQQALDRFSQAVENAGIEIVPRMVVTSGGGEQGGGTYSAFEGLMMLLLSEKLGVQMSDNIASNGAASEEIRRLRESILSSMSRPTQGAPNGGEHTAAQPADQRS
ncbi:MAG: band 7 protein [Candidatus Thermofonsia Clade 1 bacterium]|uniref:Band 7 protein n=1 Tax=Candidatus Thermofonsia Clade 1 bacterium TaxID=2364210 RepID=A0A2M8NZX9_9CHLR|nr:MAG: band 7 protein [Candidatus Thermofonsia Clade 1 bacterium]